MGAILNERYSKLVNGNTEDAPEFLSFPKAMLSFAERATLFQLAKYCYRGRGEIVDAGAFLGGSAFSLGRGLLENPAVSATYAIFASLAFGLAGLALTRNQLPPQPG